MVKQIMRADQTTWPERGRSSNSLDDGSPRYTYSIIIAQIKIHINEELPEAQQGKWRSSTL